MKSIAKKDDAVSPVIGTILLVAITVVLVAIVAAVVMGMVGNMSDKKDVGVIVQPGAGSGSVIATVASGSDAGKLTSMYVYAGDKNLTTISPAFANKVVAGQPYNFTNETPISSGTHQITVTGNFNDGTSQVLYTGNLALL